ncbi:MAG: matrixin family metalloprotease, partial [Planctomycetes bacterium]|nr:matrixin family metalloprotease [Planctomycetota bacterium]
PRGPVAAVADHSATAGRWRAGWLLAGMLLAACGEGAPTAPAVDAAATHFTVRGRWPDATRITWRAESGGAPIAEQEWQDAVARACDTWSATGAVRFVPAAPSERADVTLGWRRGHHGACEPFGTAKTVAHSGPVRAGTFVHFDADRDWVADAPDDRDGYPVYATALHELGHVLGLGHSAADDAVMKTGEIRRRPLSASDLHGLHSLYGGGRDRPGDLRVVDDRGVVRCTLRGVAPAGRCGTACFDIDGDGAQEVVVWRTDQAGNGAVMAYHFATGCALTRTTGPYYGMASYAEGARNGVVRSEAGDRLFVTRFPNGRVVARRFDQHGLLQPFTAVGVTGPLAAPQRGDLDGDGRSESIEPVTAG